MNAANENVEIARARNGMLAVVAAILGVVGLAVGAAIVLGDEKSTIAITTAAFGVISTMVTAYLGIKATANTAKEIASGATGDGDGNGKDPPERRPGHRGER